MLKPERIQTLRRLKQLRAYCDELDILIQRTRGARDSEKDLGEYLSLVEKLAHLTEQVIPIRLEVNELNNSLNDY